MTARHADEYVPPSRADVVAFSSDRIGVTDGLLLKFPQIHAVGDISLPQAGQWTFKFTARTSDVDEQTLTMTANVS